MNRLLLQKMIQKSLRQYQVESYILTANDFEELSTKIIELKKLHPSYELYDLVQDVVYG